MKEQPPYRIGSHKIIPMENAIEYSTGEKQTIQPKFVELLTYLADNYPRIIPREELIEHVWQGNQYVGEKALTNAVWHLRQLFKQSDEEQEFIETIRKVGYRLKIAPQFEQETVESPKAPPQDSDEKPSHRQPVNILLLLIIGVITVYFMAKPNTPVYQPQTITPVTKLPGSELFAAPSPNGQFIAYKWNDGHDKNHLFVSDRQQTSLPPKQLTFGEDSVGHSVWSKDGVYLYYSQKNKAKGYCQIIQLNVQTQQQRALIDCPTKGGYYYLDISPDNKTLAFHGFREPADNSGIYFFDLTSETAQPVRFSCAHRCGYKERDFAFSPDGKYVAVSRRFNRFKEDIFLVNLNTNEETRLTDSEEDIVGFTWHPDGEKLVFASQRSDTREGFIVDIKSKKITPLNISGFSYPAFVTQTRELFFQQRNERYFISALPLEEQGLSSPFPVLESEFSHHSPHYSAKQNKFVYVSNESGFYEIWLMTADGQSREKLTSLELGVRYPRWSHNGEKIAFLAPVANEPESERIYIYDLNSRQVSIVPSPHQKHNRPTWSWDDSGIISAIYESEYTDLHLIDIESGNSTRLTSNSARFGVMTSAKTMIFTGVAKGLWQMTLENNALTESAPQKLIESNDFSAVYSWAYLDNSIYFRKKFSRYNVLAKYDLRTGESTDLIKLPKQALASSSTMTVIPENKQLLFTQAKSPQSNIKQLNHPLLQ